MATDAEYKAKIDTARERQSERQRARRAAFQPVDDATKITVTDRGRKEIPLLPKTHIETGKPFIRNLIYIKLLESPTAAAHNAACKAADLPNSKEDFRRAEKKEWIIMDEPGRPEEIPKKNQILVELATIIQGEIKGIEGIDLPNVNANSVEITAKSIYVVVGRFPGTDDAIEVWLDGETGWNGEKFWYGFGSYGAKTIESLVGFGRGGYGDPGTMLDLDTATHRPREPDGFGKPVYEGRFSPKGDGDFYYGVYLDTTPTKDSKEIQDAANFILELAAKLLDYRSDSAADAESSNLGITGGEERKRLTRHYRWERYSAAANAVKDKAGYECNVCQEEMGGKYGDDIGADYAEAHDKVPLAELEGLKVVTFEKNLVCVCANCHRMLHRLIAQGENDAITELKTRVENHKKSGGWGKIGARE